MYLGVKKGIIIRDLKLKIYFVECHILVDINCFEKMIFDFVYNM